MPNYKSESVTSHILLYLGNNARYKRDEYGNAGIQGWGGYKECNDQEREYAEAKSAERDIIDLGAKLATNLLKATPVVGAVAAGAARDTVDLVRMSDNYAMQVSTSYESD